MEIAVNSNYTEKVVRKPVQEIKEPMQTIVDMSGNLTFIIENLVVETNELTMKLIGKQCELPNGGEGSLPERFAWSIEALERLRALIRDAGEFLG